MSVRRTTSTIAACLALALSVAWSTPRAQDAEAPAAAAPVRPSLYDLAALVGTWEARPVWEAAGNYHVRTTFAWILEDKFLQEDRVVTIGETETRERVLYGLDPESGALQRFQFSSNGNFGRSGDVAVHAKDDRGRIVAVGEDGTRTPYRFVFEGTLEGAWPTSTWRHALTIVDHDRFELVVSRNPGGNFLELTRQGFTRVADGK